MGEDDANNNWQTDDLQKCLFQTINIEKEMLTSKNN